MADQTVNIPNPVLAGSEKFKIRYRSLPNGAFTAFQDETNAPFVLNGLAPGNYEMEIIFVTDDGIECQSTFEYFDVIDDIGYVCQDYSAIMIEEPANSGLYYIRASFQPGSTPPCGWIITLSPLDGSTPTVLNYPQIPANNQLKIAVPNKDTYFKLTAYLCDQKEKDCATLIVSKVFNPTPCVPLVLVITEMLYNSNLGNWTLHVVFTQSNPPTKGINIQWQQVGTPVVAGTPLDSGSFVMSGWVYQTAGTNSQVYLNNKFNPTPVIGQFVYNMKMLDECGTWHNFTVQFG